MRRVDFLIANGGHHLEMMRPVVHLLAGKARCRLLSLCELRGFATPADAFSDEVEVAPILRRRRRRAGDGVIGAPVSRQRRLLRALVWRLLLAPRLDRLLKDDRPGVVVVPNDAAFPYDRIARRLTGLSIPFVLLQEGIRFPLPGVGDDDAYGAGGAVAVAAWGEASRDYFLARGVAAERIHLAGSPRFDALRGRPQPRRAEAQRPPLLLLLTNPIDQQGFCSTESKMALVAGFLDRLEGAARAGDLRLGIRIHGGESREAYQRLVDRSAANAQLLDSSTLYPQIESADAVVVMASTVGLEALLLGRPLGVLETPGHGFVHDYVERGAAIGLRMDDSLGSRVSDLMARRGLESEAVAAYVAAHLTSPGAARRVSDLIRSLLG